MQSRETLAAVDTELYAVFCDYCNGESAFVVSEGTHRLADLIPAFVSALDDIGWGATAEELEADYPDVFDILDNNALDYIVDQDEVSALMDDLYTALNDAAPVGFYFGSHEGDGALFGFWSVD